jgi:hypothetical protein
MKFRIGFFLAILCAGTQAWAYPQFIRHEYPTCVACHVSPRGGGILTDYGQGIAASLSAFTQDYEGPPTTPFYKFITADNRLTHGFQFRLMQVRKENRPPSTFPMQMDYLNVAQFNPKWRFETTLGIFVQRNGQGSVSLDMGVFNKLVLRKALLVDRYSEESEVSVGRDFLPIGLNLDDHTLYVKAKNRRGVLDFSTQARWDTWKGDWQLTPFVFAPSYEETFPNREWGLGGRAEYSITKRFTLGGTMLAGRSQAIGRELVDVFTRYSPITLFAILAEYDYTLRQSVSSGGDPQFAQHTAYLRPSAELLEWLDLGWVGEFETRESPFYEKNWKTGPSLYARLQRNVTLIVDARENWSDIDKEALFTAQLYGHF